MKWNKKLRQGIKTAKNDAEKNKPEQCPACSGSGRYDVKGSPKCGSCNGTGIKELTR